MSAQQRKFSIRIDRKGIYFTGDDPVGFAIRQVAGGGNTATFGEWILRLTAESERVLREEKQNRVAPMARAKRSPARPRIEEIVLSGRKLTNGQIARMTGSSLATVKRVRLELRRRAQGGSI